jgi:hypothetical protein
LISSYTVHNKAGSDCAGGVSNRDHLGDPKYCIQAFSLHIGFRATSGPLAIAESISADPEVNPTSWRCLSTSNHPTALCPLLRTHKRWIQHEFFFIIEDSADLKVSLKPRKSFDTVGHEKGYHNKNKYISKHHIHIVTRKHIY